MIAITIVAIAMVAVDVLTTSCERQIELRCLEYGRGFPRCLRLWSGTCE